MLRNHSKAMPIRLARTNANSRPEKKALLGDQINYKMVLQLYCISTIGSNSISYFNLLN